MSEEKKTVSVKHTAVKASGIVVLFQEVDNTMINKLCVRIGDTWVLFQLDNIARADDELVKHLNEVEASNGTEVLGWSRDVAPTPTADAMRKMLLWEDES